MTLKLPSLNPTTAERMRHDAVIARHSHWSVLKASGTGLRDYLQGQITQDIKRLTPDHAIHSCILTPQGKAVSDFYMLEGHHDELLILAPAAHAEATVARLRRFALGQDLRIGMVHALAVYSVQGAKAAQALADLGISEPESSWLCCSRHHDEDRFALVMPEQPRGYWVISDIASMEALSNNDHQLDASEIEAMRIMRGMPLFGVEWDERTHPLNANLIEFEGVSFDKGCYVGQEVTSRMHWRGGIKKKLYRVTIEGKPESIPCPVNTSAHIGELKSAAIDHEHNCVGMAHLPISVAETDAPLRLENGTLIHIMEACHA